MRVFTILFIISLGWDAWLYTLPSHTTSWNYAYVLIYGSSFCVGGVVSVISAVKFGLRSNLGKMMLFIGIGMLIYWIANIIWAYYIIFLQVPIPDPSPVDTAYMILYPFGVIGMWYMMKLYQTQITKRFVRDSVIIVSFSFVILFGLLALPSLSINVPFVPKFANAYFLFVDSIILSIAIAVLRINGRKSHPSLYIFTLGLVVLIAGEIVYAYRNTVGTYWQGDITDLFFTIGVYFFSIGLIEIISSLYQSATTEVVPAASVISNSLPDKNAPTVGSK